MVLSQWCPGDVPVIFRWCSCGVSVVSRCRSAGPVVSGVRVLSQWYPGRFPVVSRWCCRMSSGVSVVSRWLVSQLQWCRVLLCVSVVSQCSPIATRFGVYFLHGLCSCLRPFSENVRFGVPVNFLLGVQVVSRLCPGGVPVVSLWCCGGVPVVSRRCNGLVSVVSRWCPNGVPVVFRVSVVSRCHIAGPVVSRSCGGGVPVVSRSCLVMSRWCCSVCSGVAVVCWCLVPQSCPGVAVVSRGVPVVSSDLSVVGVLVVSRRCPSVGLVLPGSWWCSTQWCPRSCPVFHAAVSRPDHHFGKSAIAGRLVFCW